MRALVLLHHVFRVHGGISKFNTDFVTALAALDGCETVIALPRIRPEKTTDIPSRIVLDEGAPRGKFSYVRRVLLRLVAGGRFGLVICGHLHLLPLAFLWRLRGAPAPVLVMHGVEAWRPPRDPLARLLAARCRAYIAVSALTRERFCRWSGADPARFFILPNTIDTEKFRPGPRDPALEARFGLAGKRVILTLGRLDSLERAKGFDEVMEALPALAREMPDITYLIAGDGDDRPRLEARARALGVADRVVFSGFVDEAVKPALYRTVDAFVMPSRGEGFGIVLLEALASGLPVVGSAVDGSREALLDGVLGTLVDPEDGTALQDAIRAALATGKGEAPAALARFSEKAFGERIADIVASIQGRRR